MGSYVSHSAAPSPSRPPPVVEEEDDEEEEESRFRDLPLELLISIIQRLPLVDRVRFGCICSAFQGALQYYNLSSSSSSSSPPRSLPWLLLPDESTAAANAFFSIGDRKTYRLPQPAGSPVVENRTWLGSSDGWLVGLDQGSRQLYLLNPVTRSQIPLPPLPSSTATRSLEFSKAVVYWKKHPPPPPSRKVYAVVLMSAKRLVCARGGDQAWTSFGTRDTYSDAAICNSYLYAMKSNGTVELWDLAAAAGGGGGGRPDLVMTMIMPNLLGEFASFTKYLVGFEDDDNSSVLHVWRSREFSQVAFKIFRLDLDNKEWVEKKSLEGRVIFLNSCSSMSSTSSSSSSEDYSDCIFFHRLTSEKKRESMVFRLKDKSVERLLLHGSCWNPSPIWIAPNQSQSVCFTLLSALHLFT